MSIWNTDSIIELIKEQEKRYEQRFRAQEKAVAVAEEGAEKWRDQANEWRAAMLDRERQFFPKSLGYVVGILAALSMMITILDKLK